jgi:2-isopropylmalate synthase
LNAAFARFKELADKKSEIFDEDLQMLVGDEAISHELEHFKLLSMMATFRNGRDAGRESRDGRGWPRAQGRVQRQRPGGRLPSEPSETIVHERLPKTAALLGVRGDERHRLAGAARNRCGLKKNGRSRFNGAEARPTDIVSCLMPRPISMRSSSLPSKMERLNPQV